MDVGGYAVVILSKNGISKVMKVHRLVAEAFLLNHDNLPEVHNLKLVTRAEQMDEHWRAAQDTKLRVVGHGIDKIFISAKAVERELGIAYTNALMVAKGKYKQIKGYKIYFC